MNGQMSLFAIEAAPAPAPLAVPVVTWSGVTRGGVHSQGVLEDASQVEAFARARFRGRWRSLEVTIGGQVVAAISPDADRPVRRSLWIEGTRP